MNADDPGATNESHVYSFSDLVPPSISHTSMAERMKRTWLWAPA
jgi:hypothetical protein